MVFKLLSAGICFIRSLFQKLFGWKRHASVFHTPHASTSYKILWKKLHKNKSNKWWVNHLQSSCFFQTQQSKAIAEKLHFLSCCCVFSLCPLRTAHKISTFFRHFLKRTSLCVCVCAGPAHWSCHGPFFIVPLIIINPNSFSSAPHSIHKIHNKRREKSFSFYT